MEPNGDYKGKLMGIMESLRENPYLVANYPRIVSRLVHHSYKWITLPSECMALTYFLRGGCAIYLVLKKSFPICTRNSKCARRWRNPTCPKWAKLRHLPNF